jgi:excisionase family DNA binding protein
MPWITVKEARQKVNNTVSAGTVYELAHQGKVKATKVLGRVLIDSESFDGLIADGEIAVLKPPLPRKGA